MNVDGGSSVLGGGGSGGRLSILIGQRNQYSGHYSSSGGTGYPGT